MFAAGQYVILYPMLRFRHPGEEWQVIPPLEQSLTVGRDRDAVASMTLSFPLSTYIPTEDDEGLDGLKAAHDADAQRGQELFLALFDAISATDKRVAARRDSASAKLQTTMDTGKAAAQAANSWRFDFSLAPDTFEGTVTVLFTLVK